MQLLSSLQVALSTHQVPPQKANVLLLNGDLVDMDGCHLHFLGGVECCIIFLC